MISSVSMSYVQCYSVLRLEAETVNPAPGAEFVLSFYRRDRRGRTGGRISVAALRPSAYSPEFELGSWLSSSERAWWGARKRETLR